LLVAAFALSLTSSCASVPEPQTNSKFAGDADFAAWLTGHVSRRVCVYGNVRNVGESYYFEIPGRAGAPSRSPGRVGLVLNFDNSRKVLDGDDVNVCGTLSRGEGYRASDPAPSRHYRLVETR
jgi:hypothetical protein